MLFGDNGYYSKRQESPGFVDKLTGIAVIGGIIGGVVLARKPIASALGGLATSYAKASQRDLGGVIGGVLETASRSLLGRSARAFTEGLGGIRTSLASSILHQTRVEQEFVGFLKSRTDDAGREILSQIKTQERLQIALTKVSHAKSWGEAAKDIKSTRGRRNIHEAVGGIKFRADSGDEVTLESLEGIHIIERAFSMAIKNSESAATKKSIHGFAGKNQGTIIDTLISASEDEAHGIDNLQDTFFKKHVAHEITFADLRDKTREHRGKSIQTSVNEYFDKLGVQPDRGDTNYGLRLTQDFEEKVRDVFGETLTKENKEKFFKKFYETKTGLAITKDGSVVSLEYLQQQRRKFTEKAMENIQVPLLPGVMSVPLKLFGFAKPSADVIENVGRLIAQPELKRAAMMEGLGAGAEGLAIGESLLAFDFEKETIKKIGGEGLRLLRYKQRESAKIARQATMRSAERDQLPTNIQEALTFLKRNDEFSMSKVREYLYQNAPKFTKVGYVPGEGYAMSATDPIFNPAVEYLYGNGRNVDPRTIHPIQLFDYIQQNVGNMHPDDVAEGLHYINTEAAGVKDNFNKEIGSLFNATYDAPYADTYMTSILRNTVTDFGNASEILRGFDTQKVNGSHLLSPEGLSYLNKTATPRFNRAVTQIQQDRGSLEGLGVTDGGTLKKTISNVFGRDGSTEAEQDLAMGVLSEAVKAQGLKDVGALIGGDVRDELETLATHIDDWSDKEITNNILGGFLENNGISPPKIRELVSALTRKNKEGEIELREASLGSIGALGLDLKKMISGLTTHKAEIGAKIIALQEEDLALIEGILQSSARSNERILELGEALDVRDALTKRFSKRIWHPEQDAVDLSAGSSVLILPTTAPRMSDWLQDPMAAMKNLLTGGSIPAFGKSLIDPKAPMGPASTFMSILSQAPQDLGNAWGLGLSASDRQTPVGTVANYLGKRLLPLMVGYEAYKMFNHNLHAAGLPGLDDMAANMLASANLGSARIKDGLGITVAAQNAVSKYPGLDMYFHPKSHDEYEDYLFSGDEAVREQRLWMIGNRSPIHGGRVKYFRPNFYRRWKSHWTELADISNAENSWLPNLENPISPITHLLNPDWFTKKHEKDRPYPGDPYDALMQDRRRLNLGTDTLTYLSTNALQRTDGTVGQGRFGANLPALATGGSVEVPYGNVGGGLGGNPSGVYGGGMAGTGGLYGNDPLYVRNNNMPTAAMLKPKFGMNAVNYAADAMRQHTGLYGAMFQMLPGWPKAPIGVEPQDPRYATSFRRWMWAGEYGEATGSLGEFFRRFIAPDTQAYDAYNPLPNNQATWLPSQFRTGDPFVKLPGVGELQLPGEAYEATHPNVMPLKARASGIGGTVEEIVDSWLHPIQDKMDNAMDNIVSFGNMAHKSAQRKLAAMGVLVGSEVPVYDKKHNISGTLDAIVRGSSGMEVVDIKTIGGDKFNKGEVSEKYIDQINFYMGTTGMKRGHLAFVNRNDPTQVRIESFSYSQERFNQTIERVEKARSVIKDLQENGIISPFETYDVISRVEILARVAPNSREYREAVDAAQQGGINAWEKPRLQRAMNQAAEARKQYNLHPRNYGLELETHKALIQGFTEDGEVVTDKGVFSLAGVKFSDKSFGQKDPNEVFKELGLNVGEKANITLVGSTWNEEILNDVTMKAIIEDANIKAVRKGYATDDANDNSPLASQVRYGNALTGYIWEWMTHSDNMITNKFFRNRTALEQFERGEVFGTDQTKWTHPISTFVTPTINSFIAKDPLSATVQSAIVSSLFFAGKKAKGKAALIGGAIGGFLSGVRMIGEEVSGEVWTPKRYRKQAEFDEYWDILEYMKYTGIAEAAKKRAKDEEDVDVDALNEGTTREEKAIGPYTLMAIDAERKAKRTMYGYNEGDGSLQDALFSLPERQRQIAEDVILNANQKEKSRFYQLLPEPQQRVLGRFLNAPDSEIPGRPILEEYFKNHYLPNMDWQGWTMANDLGMLEDRAADLQGNAVATPSRAKVDKARAYTNDTPIPMVNSPTPYGIMARVQSIVGGYRGIDVQFRYNKAEDTSINIQTDVMHDQTSDLVDAMRQEIRRG